MGESTLAGSRLLIDSTPAQADAVIVKRLRDAGAAIIGKTNMTEFAFSGLGINPHHGTPLNVWDRQNGRIPGGSSSGAAISVTDGMAMAAIGTDTGGSVRIPAALNGLVGFKPTARTVPLSGTLPLSTSFDSIGPIAHSVDMCAMLYGVLSGNHISEIEPSDIRNITIGAVKNYVLDEIDANVAASYERALSRLSSAGAKVRDIEISALDSLPTIFGNGGIVAAEAYHWHRLHLEKYAEKYDPRVQVRIERGRNTSAADYLDLLDKRTKLIALWERELTEINVVAMPTVPVIAPLLKTLANDENYNKNNLLILRNPTIANALDGCAISIPCLVPGDAPVGLMLASKAERDWQLLGIAKAVENVLLFRQPEEPQAVNQ
jgi:aspartyl-tRNA(Asn)/glutamyl-tRNA(Gln) amidotransferase subunit A